MEDKELENIVREMLVNTYNNFMHIKHNVAQVEGAEDISPKLASYIWAVVCQENPTFSSLQKELGVSKPSVTQAIQKLIKLKYIKKEQSKEDRRVFHLFLDVNGEKFVESEHAATKALTELIRMKLNDEELESYKTIMNKLAEINPQDFTDYFKKEQP